MSHVSHNRCPLPLALLLYAAPALAQEVPVAPAVGSDSPEAVVAREDGGNCFVFQDYVVSTRPLPDGAGEVIHVDRRGAGAGPETTCAGELSGQVLQLEGADEARFFFGLEAPYLLVDAGTGPEYRDLTVYDLGSGEAVFQDGYFAGQPVRIREDGRLEYHVPLPREEAGGRYPCPQAGEWGTFGFEERVVVELPGGEMERTGEVQCSYRM